MVWCIRLTVWMKSSLLLILHCSIVNAAVSWHDDRSFGQQLRVFGEAQIPPVSGVTEAGCIPDVPGGRLAAAATLAAGILFTAVLTAVLMCYLIRKSSESMALPGPGAASTLSASDSVPPRTNEADTAKTADVKEKKKRIYMYSLDGLRTLLTLAVIFAHYPIGLPSICKHFLGWPMQFFFVLSGFVAQVQQEGGSEQLSWLSGWTYVGKRLCRILPLYQLALVMQFALAVYGNRGCQPVAAWPMNALLLQCFFPVKVCGEHDLAWTMGYSHFNGNGPAWFAACIIWFSCLFPVLYNARPRSTMVTCGLLGGALACRAVPDLMMPSWGIYGTGVHLYAMAPVRLLEYVAGMWAAQVSADMVQRQWQAWGCWCWFFDVSMLLLIGIVYVGLTYLGAGHACSGDYHLTAIACVVCVAARLAAEMPEEDAKGLRGGVLHRVIGSVPLSYFARFSFAAYIFQTSFMSFTDADQNFYAHRFILLWLFSAVACIYIEEPIRVFAESCLKKK